MAVPIEDVIARVEQVLTGLKEAQSHPLDRKDLLHYAQELRRTATFLFDELLAQALRESQRSGQSQ